jgi:sugar/nucleoside kinase (ribokinase family)
MAPYRGLFVGLTTIDIQHFVPEFPQPNKKVKTAPPQIFVGGPATNAAVAFSYLNKHAFLASAAGSNAFNQFVKDDFETTGIRHFDLVEKQPQNTVIASVITSEDTGDRNIFTHHPEKINPSITPGQLFQSANPDILLLDGFYPEFSLKCAQLARQKKIPVILDGGSWKPQYSELLPLTDCVICSADFLPPKVEGTEALFRYFKNAGVKNTAISRGEKNILYEAGESRGEVPVKSAEIIDTLGAGDFLHGAFCYWYLHFNFHFIKALEAASKLASFTCRFRGTRQWLNFKF